MELTGKTALVTGGSEDLGGVMVRTLAAAGADRALSYLRYRDEATATFDALHTLGREGMAVPLTPLGLFC